MKDNLIRYEVFEEEKPSYLPCYIMSGFVLMGIIGLAHHDVRLWPLSLAHLMMAVWFGVFFVWMLRYGREQKLFLSHRLTLTSDTFAHSFRYAVSEVTHVEIPLSDIEEVRVSPEEPRLIEVTGKSDSDLYVLPKNADIAQLVAAFRAGNPQIRITT